MINYLIVGCGLSGVVSAERIANKLNRKVTIIEKREHIGGNCYDYRDKETDILINKYGAHLFHTNNEEVWKYVNKFDKWIRWEHKVLTYTNDMCLVLPLFADTNMRPSLTVEISNDAFSIPLTTQISTLWSYDGIATNIGEKLNGPKYYNKTKGLVTFAVYCTGYTGRFYLQGTTSPYPDESDWFNVELGAAVDWHQFINFTGIEPFTIISNLTHLRFNWQLTGATGTVDKVVVRL